MFPLTEDYLQRRRRLRRVAIPSSQALSLLGRDLREAHLQVLLGSGGYRSSIANASNTVTDQFLSSLGLNFSATEAEEISKSVSSSAEDTSTMKAVSAHAWKSRYWMKFCLVKRAFTFSINFSTPYLALISLISFISCHFSTTLIFKTYIKLPVQELFHQWGLIPWFTMGGVWLY